MPKSKNQFYTIFRRHILCVTPLHYGWNTLIYFSTMRKCNITTTLIRSVIYTYSQYYVRPGCQIWIIACLKKHKNFSYKYYGQNFVALSLKPYSWSNHIPTINKSHSSRISSYVAISSEMNTIWEQIISLRQWVKITDITCVHMRRELGIRLESVA